MLEHFEIDDGIGLGVAAGTWRNDGVVEYEGFAIFNVLDETELKFADVDTIDVWPYRNHFDQASDDEAGAFCLWAHEHHCGSLKDDV